MFEIEDKELSISDELNRKIDKICRFACVKYDFIRPCQYWCVNSYNFFQFSKIKLVLFNVKALVFLNF